METNFTIVARKPSINIEEWKKAHPKHCAIVERDPERSGYGWIRYRGMRPYPYSLSSYEGDYSDELRCNPHDCYEIVPKDFVLANKGTKLSPERMREVLKAMNNA